MIGKKTGPYPGAYTGPSLRFLMLAIASDDGLPARELDRDYMVDDATMWLAMSDDTPLDWFNISGAFR